VLICAHVLACMFFMFPRLVGDNVDERACRCYDTSNPLCSDPTIKFGTCLTAAADKQSADELDADELDGLVVRLHDETDAYVVDTDPADPYATHSDLHRCCCCNCQRVR